MIVPPFDPEQMLTVIGIRDMEIAGLVQQLHALQQDNEALHSENKTLRQQIDTADVSLEAEYVAADRERERIAQLERDREAWREYAALANETIDALSASACHCYRS